MNIYLFNKKESKGISMLINAERYDKEGY